MPDVFEVKLDVNDLSHATAFFLSLIVLPRRAEKPERDALYDSLCAWMLHERCERDPDWANQPQWIVPRLALRPEEHIQKDMRRFDRLVRDRLTAGHIAAAFLKQAEHGAAPELPPGAARLSRNALAASVLDDLCMADPGNVLTRVWRPSRPVIHLCAAWAVSLRELDEASRKKPVLVGPLRDRIFLATVLARAEAYVPILARIDPPIPEDDLIRLRPQVG